jgi:serine/threonine-protein kinase
MGLQFGSRLGIYKVSEKNRAVGPVETYNAKDESSGSDVAIHLVSSNRLTDPQTRLVFLHESRKLITALKKINHPNICKLYAAGEIQESAFLVSEAEDGKTLEEILRDGPMTVAEALEHGKRMADVLIALHDSWMLHDDLKPSNILMTKKGLKVQHFHLAPWISPDLEEVADDSHFERVRYMSPESITGVKTDERSDIYSAGAVLYRMLMGRDLFDEKNMPRLIYSILQKDPILDMPRIPRPLCSLIQTCLERKPEARFPRASDLKHALESFGHKMELE